MNRKDREMTSKSTDAALESLKNLLLTMKTLRGPNGCAWDRRQTPDSLKQYLLEEAYEVLDALDRGTPAEICEELGDLLLQVVFQAQIFQERASFGMAEVAAAIDTKLRRRHPHIFACAVPQDHETSWEKIKQQERAAKGQSLSLDNRIPQALPALKRAEKLASAIARHAEQSQSVAASCRKIMETLQQVSRAAPRHQIAKRQIGDMLYNLTALAKSLDIDAEDALRQSVARRIESYDQSADQRTDRS
jgi:MazG family protein